MQLAENGVEIEGDPQKDPVSHGVVTGDSKFRVIPRAVNPDREDSPVEASFYIDGREVSSKEFAGMLPEGVNINQMVEKGYKDAGLGWSTESKSWRYTPRTSGDWRQATEERKAYEESGDQGVIDLYNQRTQARNDAYYRRGGGTGPDQPGSYTPQPMRTLRN